MIPGCLKQIQHGPGASTNNYCKWFHVVEHESNHNGQINMDQKASLPVSKAWK
jgi:hypothetical protein